MGDKDNFTLTITWCKEHKNWWITSCPECMVDVNEESIKREGIAITDDKITVRISARPRASARSVRLLVSHNKIKGDVMNIGYEPPYPMGTSDGSPEPRQVRCSSCGADWLVLQQALASPLKWQL